MVDAPNAYQMRIYKTAFVIPKFKAVSNNQLPLATSAKEATSKTKNPAPDTPTTSSLRVLRLQPSRSKNQDSQG